MNFKKGDKVVCINNVGLHNLKENKIYTVSQIIYSYDAIKVNGIMSLYTITRFISLIEYKRRKLEKICKKIKI